MAELMYAFLAEKRLHTDKDLAFSGMLPVGYVSKYPYHLGNKFIISYWKLDEKEHQVQGTCLFEGTHVFDYFFDLVSSDKPDRFRCHAQKFEGSLRFKKPGRFEFTFLLDGAEVHKFPYFVFHQE